jgi:hypothetical protein
MAGYTYATLGKRKLDIYLPAEGNGSSRLLLAHGGASIWGSKSDMQINPILTGLKADMRRPVG